MLMLNTATPHSSPPSSYVVAWLLELKECLLLLSQKRKELVVSKSVKVNQDGEEELFSWRYCHHCGCHNSKRLLDDGQNFEHYI